VIKKQAITTLEKLLVPFTNKGKQVSLKLSGNETGTEICNRRNSWGPMGTGRGLPKSCDHCTAQKMVCTIAGIWVFNWKQQDKSGGEGSQPKKNSWVEVELDAESVGSGIGGWRQEVSSALVEISGLLREQKNGYLKRIAQSLDGGLGAGEDDEDSTIRE